MRRKPLGNQDLADQLRAGGVMLSSTNPANTVGSVLNRRATEVGDIVRVGRGTWGLAEWYPNPQRFRKGAGKAAEASPEAEDSVDPLS
jgi:hypothetical protein